MGEPQSDGETSTTIDIPKWVSFRLVTQLVVGAFFAAVIWLKLDSMQRDLRQMWTFQHQLIWSERLSNKNQNIFVPDPIDVIKTLEKK